MKLLQIAALTTLLVFHGAASAQEPPAPAAAAVQDAPAQQATHTVDPKKAQVIHQILELTGAANIGKQMMDALMAAEKQAHPDVDPTVWDRLAVKLDINDVLGSIIEIYDRHFSTEDLQATLAFYQSPAGQRVLKELPPVMKESMAVGQEWGRRKAMELMKELEQEQQNRVVPTKA